MIEMMGNEIGRGRTIERLARNAVYHVRLPTQSDGKVSSPNPLAKDSACLGIHDFTIATDHVAADEANHGEPYSNVHLIIPTK